MSLDEFIQFFAEQFEDTPIEAFNAETIYKNLDEWSSLIALSIISVVDEDLDKQLTGKDLREANTINDLYNIVINK